jgi:hypothetical protein
MSRTALPPRLQGAAIDRISIHSTQVDPPTVRYWRVWLHTNDHKHGTFLELHDDGSIIRVTTQDGYEDRVIIKPKDD